MRPFRCTFVMLALFVGVIAEPAYADPSDAYRQRVNREIDSWSREKRVVVAKEVRESLAHPYWGYSALPSTWTVLEKLPILRITVQPVPPRDYSVKIKDHDYGAIEKICVRAGSISLRIERAGKPACHWAGTLSEGDEQTVACNF